MPIATNARPVPTLGHAISVPIVIHRLSTGSKPCKKCANSFQWGLFYGAGRGLAFGYY